VPRRGVSVVELSREDIDVCLLAGILETTTEEDLRSAIPLHLFTVFELRKRRRRLICDTAVNIVTEVSLEEEIALPTPANVMSIGSQFVMTADAPAYYQQFALPLESRKYFSFAAFGKCYRLTTISTGQRHSVPLAQTLARELWNDAYIDNFRILAKSQEELNSSMERFFSRARELQIQVEIEAQCDSTTQQQEYDYLGGHFTNMGSRCFVQNTQKTREKLAAILQDLSQTSLSTSWANVESMLGVTQFAALLAGLSPVHYYWVFKFWRRKAAQYRHLSKAQARATIVEIWPSIIPTWVRWIEGILLAEPREIRNLAMRITDAPQEQWTMITDASDIGWAAILFKQDTYSVVSGVWRPWQKRWIIAEREASAVVLGLKEFQQNRQLPMPTDTCDAKLHCIIDNTTVLGAHRKKRSRSYWLNQKIATIELLWPNLTMSYITTDNNIADGPSRGNQLAPEEIESWWTQEKEINHLGNDQLPSGKSGLERASGAATDKVHLASNENSDSSAMTRE